MAKDLMEDFEKEWEPLMENIKEADETFANLDGTAIFFLECYMQDGNYSMDLIYKNCRYLS